jgi:hypothetical protein
MIDLRNINTGKKLVKQIIKNNQSADAPWSKSNQYLQLQSQKNVKPKSKK